MRFLEGASKSLIGDFIAVYFLARPFRNEARLIAKEELVLASVTGFASSLNLRGEANIFFIVITFWVIITSLNGEERSDNLVRDIISIIIVYNIFKGLIDDDILIAIIITLYYIYEEDINELFKEEFN